MEDFFATMYELLFIPSDPQIYYEHIYPVAGIVLLGGVIIVEFLYYLLLTNLFVVKMAKRPSYFIINLIAAFIVWIISMIIVYQNFEEYGFFTSDSLKFGFLNFVYFFVFFFILSFIFRLPSKNAKHIPMNWPYYKGENK